MGFGVRLNSFVKRSVSQKSGVGAVREPPFQRRSKTFRAPTFSQTTLARRTAGFLCGTLLAVLIFALLAGSRMSQVQAEQESPYRVSEFAVRVAPLLQSNPVISGKWVLWQDGGRVMEAAHGKGITGRNLDTGLDFAISSENYVETVDVGGDPANKYYFTIVVDGVTTYTNVWAHGADARTYFPQIDTPTQSCGTE